MPVADVTNVAIWGNHSATQFPDFAHARIGGKPAPDVITDTDWLAGRVHRDGAEARRGGHRGARLVVGGVGRARGDRLGEQRLHADARRRLALARGRAATASTACPRACSSASRSRSDGDVAGGRRGHRARRLRAGARSRSRPRSSSPSATRCRAWGSSPSDRAAGRRRRPPSGRDVDRVVAFSDGVFAIAITLLDPQHRRPRRPRRPARGRAPGPRSRCSSPTR